MPSIQANTRAEPEKFERLANWRLQTVMVHKV